MHFIATATITALLTATVLANPFKILNRDVLAALNEDTTTPFPFEKSAETIVELASAFDFLEHIPDTILQAGDNATTNYVNLHSTEYVQALTETTSNDLETRGIKEVLKCAYELTTTFIPAAKLLKLKKAITAAGGATKAAKALLAAKNLAAAKQLGQAFVDIINVITGYTAIRDACFGWV